MGPLVCIFSLGPPDNPQYSSDPRFTDEETEGQSNLFKVVDGHLRDQKERSYLVWYQPWPGTSICPASFLVTFKIEVTEQPIRRWPNHDW